MATAAAVMGLEWLSALIPVFLLLCLSVCCYRRKRKNNSSQTDEPTEMAVVEPQRPVAAVSGQVRGEATVIIVEDK